MIETESAQRGMESFMVGPASQGGGVTIGAAAGLFIDHCQVAKALSVHTLRAYAMDLADFAVFVGSGIRVTTIDRAMIRSYARLLLGKRG